MLDMIVATIIVLMTTVVPLLLLWYLLTNKSNKLKWFRNLFRPKAERVAEAIEDDVMASLLAYGRSKYLTAGEMRLYVDSINRSLQQGGMNLATVVTKALEDARGTTDE